MNGENKNSMTPASLVFLPPQALANLKQGYLGFTGWDGLDDPFLENRRIYQPEQLVEPMSDQEFADALEQHYQAMDANMKNMVSWAYYLEQAQKNRVNVEAQLQKAQKPAPSLLPQKKHYASVCCLRLFQGLQSDLIWQLHGLQHQGFCVALDTQHGFFQDASYAKQPQMFKPVVYEDGRPPAPSRTEPFPAWFQRGQNWRFEQEWRLVRPKNAADKDGLLFKMPKGLIQGIYLGMHVPKAMVQTLRQLVAMDLNFRRVPVYHMGVSQEYLRLVPMDITER